MNPVQSEETFASLLQNYFSDYLISQRNVSPCTVSSYRDAFRLLLNFARQHLRKPASNLTLMDLDVPLVLAFLKHLELKRKNSVRSRNARLAAIRSFMHYVTLKEPTALPTVNRLLAIPLKRFDRPSVDFLSREEIRALLQAPDTSTWSGQRDNAMFATFYNTGARVTEIAGLNVEDFHLDATATLRIRGKGRKERVVPLWKNTKQLLRDWLCHIRRDSKAPLFPNRHGERLTRSGIRTRFQYAFTKATESCETLHRHSVSPHLIRHTTAMHLLQSGVDITVIALWLGHESPATTHMYVEADLTMKKRAINKLKQPLAGRSSFRPSDRLLTFLDAL